MARLMKRGLGA